MTLIELESDLLAVCLSFLKLKDMQRVSIALPTATGGVVEFASQLSLSSLMPNFELTFGESHTVALLLINTLLDIHDDEQLVFMVFQPWKSSQSQVEKLRTGSSVMDVVEYWIKTTKKESTSTLMENQRISTRMMKAATWYSKNGLWTVGTKLMLAARSDRQLKSTCIIDGEVLITASNFITDRLYSSTYVGAGDPLEDSNDLLLACDLSWNAASTEYTAEVPLMITTSHQQPSYLSALREKAICKPKTIYPDSTTRRGAALLAFARARGLLGQFLALGAAVGDATELDFVQVFKEAETACLDALNLFSSATVNTQEALDEQGQEKVGGEGESSLHVHTVGVAEAKAVLAEVYYCAASATQYKRNSAPILGTETNWQRSVEELTRMSLQGSQDALMWYRDNGLGETQASATILKDLGKVQSFSGDGASARLSFQSAQEIQLQLVGEEHPLVENIKRLARTR